MIQPVNNHLLIKPVVHDSFIASQTETYEEIGEVLAADKDLLGVQLGTNFNEGTIAIGDKVYFDAWLAAKFPGDKDGEHYWLVKWEDVRAIENAE